MSRILRASTLLVGVLLTGQISAFAQCTQVAGVNSASSSDTESRVGFLNTFSPLTGFVSSIALSPSSTSTTGINVPALSAGNLSSDQSGAFAVGTFFNATETLPTQQMQAIVQTSDGFFHSSSVEIQQIANGTFTAVAENFTPGFSSSSTLTNAAFILSEQGGGNSAFTAPNILTSSASNSSSTNNSLSNLAGNAGNSVANVSASGLAATLNPNAFFGGSNIQPTSTSSTSTIASSSREGGLGATTTNSSQFGGTGSGFGSNTSSQTSSGLNSSQASATNSGQTSANISNGIFTARTGFGGTGLGAGSTNTSSSSSSTVNLFSPFLMTNGASNDFCLDSSLDSRFNFDVSIVR